VLSDVIIVNSAMWTEGWERGERGKSQRAGQLLPGRGPELMGILHHEQETGPPSKLELFIIFAGGSINTCLYIVSITTNCTLCK
jgi:hypothetical protein